MQQPSFIQAAHKRQTQQQRHDLLQFIEQESHAMQPLLLNFVENEDKSERKSLTILQQLIAMVERMEQAAAWDESLYLSNLIKPFRALRSECLQSVEVYNNRKRAENQDLLLCDDNQKLVYITLYQKGGYDLSKWLSSIKVLPNSVISRPIYNEESQVAEVMRSAKNKETVGYVIVKVHPQHICHGSSYQVRTDIYGHALITLAEASLQLSQVVAFVHCGKKYRVTPEKLYLVRS